MISHDGRLQHGLRRAAWVWVPLSVFAGDVLLRWGGAAPPQWRSAPANLLISATLSLGFWWAISRLFASRSRWRFVALVPLTGFVALATCAGWQYTQVTGGEPGNETVVYLFQEPRSALGLSTAGFSWGWALGYLLLVASWVGALAAWTGAPTPFIRRICVLALPVFCLILLTSRPAVHTTGSPYVGDFRSVRLLGRSLSALINRHELLLSMRERPALAPAQPIAGPNVLLIINESLRRDHMQVYGYPRPTTPHLDAFFRQHPDAIFDFDAAFSPAASTFWSWTAMLSGQYSARPQAHLLAQPYPWQVGQAHGLTTFLYSPQDWAWMAMKSIFLTLNPPDHWATADAFHAPVVNDAGIDDRLAVDRAIQRLRHLARQGAPFFGIVQTNATHMPFLPAEDVSWPIDAPFGRYDAAVARVDQAFHALVTALRETDQLDDTIILFTSDHAEFMYGHTDVSPVDTGWRGLSCHPEVTHVPFFLYVPPRWQARLDTGHLRQNTRHPVSHVDIFPTVLDLWGYDTPDALPGMQPMDGQSLLQPLAPERVVWCFNTPSWRSAAAATGLAGYSARGMFYLRGDLAQVRQMTTPDWLSARRWPHWDALGPSARDWIIHTLDDSDLAQPYAAHIRDANPDLAAALWGAAH